MRVSEAVVPDEKQMRLRYPGSCRLCSAELSKGTSAVYEKDTKTVRCISCSGPSEPPAGVLDLSPNLSVPVSVDGPVEVPAEVDPGTPGASARREFERRQARREERIRARHKRLGGLILAVSDDPHSTRAWGTGAVGEERLGARLNGLAGDDVRVLHDRKLPGSSANIDHLVVTPAGVFVIDAKRYRGRPRLVVDGGLLRPRVEKLTVGGRDRTTLVDGVLKQVEVVRGVVGDDVPVRGVLCFVDADWPLVGGSFVTRGVVVLWPRKLVERLNATRASRTSQVVEVHRLLARRLRAGT